MIIYKLTATFPGAGTQELYFHERRSVELLLDMLQEMLAPGVEMNNTVVAIKVDTHQETINQLARWLAK